MRSLSGDLMKTLDSELYRFSNIGRDPGKRYCARLYHSSSGIHSWTVYFAIVSDTDSHIAVSILCSVSLEVASYNQIGVTFIEGC